MGCDSEPDPDDVGEKADGTAAALAEALASGDFAEVRSRETTGAEATATWRPSWRAWAS